MALNVTHIAEHCSILNLCRGLPLFTPQSGGSYAALAEEALQAANQCFPLLAHLIEQTGSSRLRELTTQQFASLPPMGSPAEGSSVARELKAFLDKYGSDKANSHDWHLVYGPILTNKNSVRGLLEIGIGTNNADVMSNMGRSGRPGASLRAFRDLLPNASIYGADIDRRILFEEPRIKTCFVDQTNLESYHELRQLIPGGLEVIIDDGLHAPNANVSVLIFAMEKLNPGGWLVVEDIPTRTLPFWHVVAAVLPGAFECYLLTGALASMFLVRKGA